MGGRQTRHSLSGRILKNTTLNILAVVTVCCGIMLLCLQYLAKNILLDSLQPMARQSAKTVEANIHMLADRMMTLAGDCSMPGAAPETARTAREEILTEAAETYEFYAIALYSPEGRLVQGLGDAPENLEDSFFALLKETDNLTTSAVTALQGRLGITMGMPVKEDGKTTLYLVGVYKYDALNDVIRSINLGREGMAYMVNREGIVTGHPDQSLVLEGSTLFQLCGGQNEAMDRVTTGETGAVEFPVGGEDMLVAFSPVRGTQWSLVIQIPKSDYDHTINGAMMMALAANLAVFLVSILFVLRLSGSISRPVKGVTGRMEALAQGDLHGDVVSVRSGDELEVLAQTLADTTNSLKGYISDIQEVLTQVAQGNLGVEPREGYKGDFVLIRGSLQNIIGSMNETIGGFRAAAGRLAQMADEMNGQSVQLYQASLEQNQSTEALVCEVSHVKERLNSVTESTRMTRAKTGEITHSIQEANQQMGALSRAMDDIHANVQEVIKLAKAIEDISFQTNILSINASVEAARAGSAGKGFAVVAEEVKELAFRSAEAAQSASEIVSGTRTIIQTGVELTAHTAGSLEEISGVSSQINVISDQLVAAVKGQQSALAIMEERIGEISAIADRNLKNAGGTEESSSLLAKEAEALRSRVEKFVLKKGV